MKRHLKRYAAPASWHIERKTTTFITKPSPGAHTLTTAMPLSTWLMQLGFAKNQKEIRLMLRAKKVLIDGKRTKNPSQPLGLFDQLNIPEVKLSYQVQFDTKGRLVIIPSTNTEKICKIIGKKNQGKNYQLLLSGGRTLQTKENTHHVHDSITLTLPEQKLAKHLPLSIGVNIMLIGGKHVGNKGSVERIEGQKVWCNINNSTIETRKKFICVIP